MKVVSLFAVSSSSSSIRLLLLLLLLLLQVSAQPQRSNVKGDPNPDLTGVDPSLIVRPPEGIDYPGCFKDLVTSDRDGNGIVEQKEYLGFIQEYGKRICYETDALTLEQQAAFNSLACLCRSREGNDASCCLQGNAKLPTAGALNPTGRTEEQFFYLTTVCTVTDGTIDSKCPPYILDRETPPPVVIVPVDPVGAMAVEPVASGMSDAAKWGLIAAAIALAALLCFLCCCCCVLRRKRAKAMEEQEEVVESTPGKGVDDEEAPPQEQAAPRELASVPPIPPTVLDTEEEEESYDGEGRTREGGYEVDDDGEGRTREGGYEVDDESDGEGRRKRGSNYVPEDEEDTRRKWPGAELPPPQPQEPERVVLRPIPVKEQEDDPDWDQPAREMDEHKVKDDDSVQEFERYVPDGGVQTDDRESKDPVTWKKDWNLEKPPENDEHDNRKHRIQSGLGEGEVWDKLDDTDDDGSRSHANGAGGDVFDWVVQSALGVLDHTDEQGHLDDSTSVAYSAAQGQGSFNNY